MCLRGKRERKSLKPAAFAMFRKGVLVFLSPKMTASIGMVEKEASHSRTLPFGFTGKTGEYFEIWIVSIFLTLLTLEVYSHGLRHDS